MFLKYILKCSYFNDICKKKLIYWVGYVLNYIFTSFVYICLRYVTVEHQIEHLLRIQPLKRRRQRIRVVNQS